MTPQIPKLRFPEFTGEWEERKISEIAEKVNSGKTPLGGEAVYTESGILFIRSQNVLDNRLSLENSTYISEEVNNTMRNSIVKPKDILLNITGASLGRSCVVPENFTIGNVNQHVCIIRVDKNNEPQFLQAIFVSEKGQNLFNSLQTGSGREGLNFQSIKGIVFLSPSLPEQTKIANFLTAIDTKIQQLTQKKALLEEYKKGVMQQLFTQQIRFKDENGEDYPDWEEKKLGSFSKITTGSSNREDSNLEGKYTFFDRSQDIRSSNIFLFDAEAIIVAGEGQEFIPKYFVGKFDLHQRTYAIMNFEGVNGKFLFYQIDKVRHYFFAQAVGSTVKSLRLPMFERMPILLPSLPEQTKIANFLTAIDAKIETVAKQIAQTQAYKKGLLQQMFI